MGKISAETHKFYRQTVPGDGTCLYWSFLFGIAPRLIGIFGNISFNQDLKNALNEHLRIEVANYIREHTELHKFAIHKKYKTIEEYCSAIEQGKLHGGDLEKKVLSTLFNILICEINPRRRIKKGSCLLPAYYGEDNLLATECVYIYYNGVDHFDALYVADMKNSNNKQTMFDPNDPIINNILKEFIKKELKYDGEVELGVRIVAPVNEVSKPTDDETTKLNDMFPSSSTSCSYKRPFDNISMSSNDNKQVPESNSGEYYGPHKSEKLVRSAADQMSTYYKIKSETKRMRILIQSDDTNDESDMEGNQSEIPNVSADLKDEHHEEKVEGEKEVVNKFDGDIQVNNEYNCSSEQLS